jgi:hypothetical protein
MPIRNALQLVNHCPVLLFDRHTHLFILLVPSSHNHHERRRYTRFQQAQEESLGVDALEVLAHNGQQQADSPKGDNARHDALDWEALG